MPPTLRCFVAVETTGEVRARTRRLVDELRPSTESVRWVEPESLHLTLKFLGEINFRDVAEVSRALEKAAREIPPFLVEVGGTGAFPTADRPRTVWVGVRQGADEMVALHEAVERELRPLGFRSEQRRFRPHLTIGRVRRSPDGEPRLAGALAQTAGFTAGVIDVGEIVLFSSELDRHGPTYEPLAVIELAGR